MDKPWPCEPCQVVIDYFAEKHRKEIEQFKNLPDPPHALIKEYIRKILKTRKDHQ